jgi:hypothetical protein
MPPQDHVAELLRRFTESRPEGTKKPLTRRSSFAGVSDAIGSEQLKEGLAVELGAVWAAMPDLTEPTPEMPDLDPGWRRPLRAYPMLPKSQAAKLVVLVDGLPDGLDAAGHRSRA